jgi:pyruvate-ferredoxin/flavodoxin oxidoreductase
MTAGKNDGDKSTQGVKYPGKRTATDGSGAVVAMETAGGEAAGAYPITPSTQMGEGFAVAVAAGKTNVQGRQLIFFEPEGEHAAAAVTAGMSLTGLRASNFSSGQGIAYMHESLYAAVGKRLTYVLNIACRAMTKHALNVHAGHDDYHCIDDTGFFQLFAKDVQGTADFNLITRRIAELSLNPGVCAQDGFLTSHTIETMNMPERELVREFLGDPDDIIDSPTPAQRLVLGEKRRRVPELYDMDFPAMLGTVQNQDSYAQGVAAQRPFYFDHIQALTDQAFAEYGALTGRHYQRVMGYRLEDADWVIAGQGSVISNAEAVVDHLRETRDLKVGVLDVAMFRPFPADLVTQMLRGKRGVAVLERTDQPLAVDAPLLRELRAAMAQGLENAKARGTQLPHPGLARVQADEIPEFYSGCFGLGSRDLQPNHIVAAVDNMLPGASQRRQFYLGIDFIRKGTRLPKLQIWQEKLLDGYPHLADLTLEPGPDVDLMPQGATSLRIHSVGGWGAITMGKNVAQTAADLLGLYIKANPKYGSEKKGQPTTFYATLAAEPVRLNCELKHVNVVLSPDPNVFRHSNPLAGLSENGVFVIQSGLSAKDLWNSLPQSAQRDIREKKIQVYYLDAFQIAAEIATNPDLRYRMQGAAFMGAFFRSAPLMEKHGLDEGRLFDGIGAQVNKKFGHLGKKVVDENLLVIRRGFDEARLLDPANLADEGVEGGRVPVMPAILDGTGQQQGIGNTGRFWEQVCHLYKTGEDGIADPYAALSAIPAATSSIRDMTDMRFEVPEFVPSKCTGCSACWTQCPDSAIPGVVNTVEEVLEGAIRTVSNGQTFDRFRQIVKHLGREARRILRGTPFTTFSDVLKLAYDNVAQKVAADPERRQALDREFQVVANALVDFPLAKTAPFFDVPENQEKDTGGLLSITVNPETCKGCNICVDVCPSGALVTIKQDDQVVEDLKRRWALWHNLPDTDDRYVDIASIDEAIGILPSLLLKKENYMSMVGGDGACMGCGEKTGIHLVVSSVHAMVLPRVKKLVSKLETMMDELDRKARGLLSADADLESLRDGGNGQIDLPVDAEKRLQVERIVKMLADLKDLHWRYTEGPSGKGRASLGFTNSTGCSSVWASTYPYNPYPFPWVNHLFQDAPSIAIGIFEGHMRKMADNFISIRRAELELAGEYDRETHETFFAKFDWEQFTDDEFHLCPPIIAVGGDGAMLDIGFQNLSRLLASDKPVRVVVLDTQVYSNTGGQASTGTFTGQVADMAAFGKAHQGKEELRKELSLIAMAHRQAYVLQTSQALPSHLIGGVLRGLQTRRPALFIIHSPCPPEHGLADYSAMRAAKLTLESRAFPLLVYDPDVGGSLAESLSLDGNPAMDEIWPSYDLPYKDEEGNDATLTLPLTIADWAYTEGRFKRHFKRAGPDDELVPFGEYVLTPKAERGDEIPFIYTINTQGGLQKVLVSGAIVHLAEERLDYWHRIKQLAGLEASSPVHDLVEEELEGDFEDKAAAIRAEYEVKLTELRASYPRLVARRMAEGLVKAGNGTQTVADLLTRVQSMDLQPIGPIHGGPVQGGPVNGDAVASSAPVATATATAVAAAPAPAAETDDGELAMDPFIESARCTTCHECTNLNRKMFVYNDKKQAVIADPDAGTYKQLVMAAEKCPVKIIHPGTPRNPKEKDLEKWQKRAERFN